MDDRTLPVGHKHAIPCPCEACVRDVGGGGEDDVSSKARGLCGGLGGDGAADGDDGCGVIGGASELVLHGDGVGVRVKAVEGRVSLEVGAVDRVGVFAAGGSGDGDGAVGFEAGGVVHGVEFGLSRRRVHGDVGGSRVGTVVGIGGGDGVFAAVKDLESLFSGLSVPEVGDKARGGVEDRGTALAEGKVTGDLDVGDGMHGEVQCDG